MKYWKHKRSEEGLSFEKVMELIENDEYFYAAREESDEILFENYHGSLCMLLKTGEVVQNPMKIPNKDKNDWFGVTITMEALSKIVSQTRMSSNDFITNNGMLVSFNPNKTTKEEVIGFLNSQKVEDDCILTMKNGTWVNCMVI